MPLLEVHLLTGRTDEQKRALLDALTRATTESLGVPLGSVRVWIQEMPPREYMVGGTLAADRAPPAPDGG